METALVSVLIWSTEVCARDSKEGHPPQQSFVKSFQTTLMKSVYFKRPSKLSLLNGPTDGPFALIILCTVFTLNEKMFLATNEFTYRSWSSQGWIGQSSQSSAPGQEPKQPPLPTLRHMNQCMHPATQHRNKSAHTLLHHTSLSIWLVSVISRRQSYFRRLGSSLLFTFVNQIVQLFTQLLLSGQ